MLISDIIQDEQASEAQSLDMELEQIQILIAESETELVSLFETYLSSVGVSAKIANTGDAAIDFFFVSKKNDKSFDAILLDTHLSNPSGLDVAKKIRSEKPDQKLVIITTTPKEHLPKDCLKTAGIKDKDILTMPFRMSELLTALKN
jgi:DNA-binding response OmpR family regulator